MNIIKVLPKHKVRKVLEVNNRIAINDCPIIEDELKIFDENGCEIDHIDSAYKHCKGGMSIHPSTGEQIKSYNHNGSTTKELINTGFPSYTSDHALYLNDKDIRNRHVIYPGTKTSNINSYCKNYVIVCENKIELNFDTSFITIENKEIITKWSDIYNTNIPVIPDNGLVIEAICAYCMMKMLSRGYKHSVFSLAAANIELNPGKQWRFLLEEAKKSIKYDNLNGALSGSSFRNYFYNFTFMPRE